MIDILQINNNNGNVVNNISVMSLEQFELELKSLCERDDIDLEFEKWRPDNNPEQESWFRVFTSGIYHDKIVGIELFDNRMLTARGKTWSEALKKALEAFDNREYK